MFLQVFEQLRLLAQRIDHMLGGKAVSWRLLSNLHGHSTVGSNKMGYINFCPPRTLTLFDEEYM